MAKTKREFILITCFLSGAAAILSFVALGTEEWVTSAARFDQDKSSSINFGLFSGTFVQNYGQPGRYHLTMVCAYDVNICGLLCGENRTDNLKLLHDGKNITTPEANCEATSIKAFHPSLRGNNTSERVFINAGTWMCTIIFLVLSAIMGLFSTGLAVWNTAANPYQVYFSIFGLYIYNAIACFFVFLSIVLWGAMYAQTLTTNIPTFPTYGDGFTTDAKLGYSYWITLPALFLYLISIGLLYLRSYLISKEPKAANVQLEDSADPVIYLY